MNRVWNQADLKTFNFYVLKFYKTCTPYGNLLIQILRSSLKTIAGHFSKFHRGPINDLVIYLKVLQKGLKKFEPSFLFYGCDNSH